MGKPKRKFADVVKRQAVDDYVSGRKSAAQVAASLEVDVGHVYKWKTQFEEKAKGAAVDELEASGRSREDAKLIADLKRERDEYQKMVGEQTVILELLKKRILSTSSVERSALTGLIETLERAAQKRKPGRS
jgi:transposase-like protein